MKDIFWEAGKLKCPVSIPLPGIIDMKERMEEGNGS